MVGRRSASAERSKKKGRGKRKGVAGESSQAGDDGEEGRWTVWTPEECVAVAKAWVNVCEDPIRSNNQTIDRMWTRISEAYDKFKPRNANYHTSEELRKQCERIKVAVSIFSSIYDNNTRSMTSGMTMEDVKRLSYQQFPKPRKHSQFKYCETMKC